MEPELLVHLPHWTSHEWVEALPGTLPRPMHGEGAGHSVLTPREQGEVMIDKREESLFLSSQKRAEWFKISLAEW